MYLIKKHFNLPNVLILILSVASFATTFIGLKILSGTDSYSLGTLFLGLGVFLLQTGLVFSLLSMIRFHGFKRIFFFIQYFVFMNVSVYFSYNFYYEFLQSDNFETKVIDESINTVIRSSDLISSDIETLNIELSELSKYSSETALIEKKSGRTCDPSVGSGEGPRRFLRDSEAVLFTSIKTDFESLVFQLSSFQVELKKIEQSYLDNKENIIISELEADINRVANSINTLTRVNSFSGTRESSSRLELILSRLIPSKTSNRVSMKSFDTRTQRETTVSCPDSKIGQVIDNILRMQFDEIKELKLFDGGDDRQVMDRSIKVYLSIFGASNNSENTEIYKFTSSDYFPLIAGFFVDLAILIIPLWAGLLRKNPPITKDDAIKAQMFMTRKFNLGEPYIFLTSIMYKNKSGYFLIVPSLGSISVDSNENLKIARELSSLLEIWSLRNHVSIFIRHVKGKKIPIDNLSIYQYEGAKEDRFDVYKLHKTVWNDYIVKMYEELDISNS